MTRCAHFGSFTFLVLAVVSFSVWFAPLAMAATAGFYTATFDPPTQAEIGMLRCALGDAGVRKECAALGKSIALNCPALNR